MVVVLVGRYCDTDKGVKAQCTINEKAGGQCLCKTDLCNTGTVQWHLSVVHEMIVSYVTVTAVVGRIFHY